AVQGQNRFFFNGMPQQEPSGAGSDPVRFGDAFLIKGMQSTRLSALEPHQMKLLWERPVSKSSRVLGTIQGVAFLGGAELSAMDLETRRLLWSTPLPAGSSEARVLMSGQGIWQFTPRGIVEIDPATGNIRRILRGSDLGSTGGDLIMTDSVLL